MIVISLLRRKSGRWSGQDSIPTQDVTAIKLAVIPAWMPESSVQGRQAEVLGTPKDSSKYPGKSGLPSLALDSGIHAGMTSFLNLGQ